MKGTYVIGLSKTNLLQIEFGMNWSNGQTSVQRITWGVQYIDEATMLPGKNVAMETLQEIKDNYDKILVFAPTVFEALVNGDDIDVNKLHIYKVELGREVE